MYDLKPKKMSIIYILEILKKYTDEKHTLTQKDIIDLLERDYGMKVDRKSVKRNLDILIAYPDGYEIKWAEKVRINVNGEEEIIQTDWYILHDFEDSELRLMIDSLLFSNNISHNHKKRLIEKIGKLSNKYFATKVKHVNSFSKNEQGNKQLFYTIEILAEAISENRKVKFLYNEIGVDKKPRPRKRSDGTTQYIINPYQMVATNGAYYLICNTDPHHDLGNYRVDRISNIEILDEKRKPVETLHKNGEKLDLQKYMEQHIYMYSGESVRAKFRIKQYMLTEIYDWFGEGMTLTDISADEVTVTVTVNFEAMWRWALQYAVSVKVLSPPELVDKVKEELGKAVENYEL